MADSRHRRPKRAVGWDLDSTLCSTMHRRRLVPEIKAGRATWDDYADLCVDDEPVAGAVALARELHADVHPQYAISARSQRAWGATEAWLMRHDVPMDHLLLVRPEGDVTTDAGVLKAAKLNELQAQGIEFCFYLEDWAEVGWYITKHTGIPVLGVNPFDPETALVSQDQLAIALEEALTYQYFHERRSGKEMAAAIFSRLGGAF